MDLRIACRKFEEKAEFMKSLLTLLLLLCPFLIFSQSRLSGIVIDDTSREPLVHTLVYLDGTSIGTITDDKGCFELKAVPVPSTLVISCLNYKPKTVLIDGPHSEQLIIKLQERVFDLSEIRVSDKNMRVKNIRIFKEMFLGADKWGKNAVLNNDSVLQFDLHYDARKILLSNAIKEQLSKPEIKELYELEEGSDSAIFRELSVFKATALAPLLVDLPLLGYQLRIDLVDFSIKYTNGQSLCSFLGYYYFQPGSKKGTSEKIKENRESVYYNSTQHFLRSLYDNALEQNGYQLGLLKQSRVKKFQQFKTVSIRAHITYQPDEQMLLTGLKDSTYRIIFYGKNGVPLNLKDSKETAYSSSESNILFLSDSCRVTKDGIVPNSNVVFGGTISTKKVGTFLPNDYVVLPKNKMVVKGKVP